uniref:PGG domain-containing protein n=1 Tax=Oryza meridionalis TaxID=40149 RepID=A0A0E0E0U7_9ORYZ
MVVACHDNRQGQQGSERHSTSTTVGTGSVAAEGFFGEFGRAIGYLSLLFPPMEHARQAFSKPSSPPLPCIPALSATRPLASGQKGLGWGREESPTIVPLPPPPFPVIVPRKMAKYRQTSVTEQNTKRTSTCATPGAQPAEVRTRSRCTMVDFLISSSSACPRGSPRASSPGTRCRRAGLPRHALRRRARPRRSLLPRSPDGNVIDCVPPHLQPAFDHSKKLRGQKPEVEPEPEERPKVDGAAAAHGEAAEEEETDVIAVGSGRASRRARPSRRGSRHCQHSSGNGFGLEEGKIVDSVTKSAYDSIGSELSKKNSGCDCHHVWRIEGSTAATAEGGGVSSEDGRELKQQMVNNHPSERSKDDAEPLEFQLRKYLLLLAIMVATVTYTAGFNPPGGVWQDTEAGHLAGDSIIRDTHYPRYLVFFYCNAAAFAMSIVVIIIIFILALIHDTKKLWISMIPLRMAMVLDLLGLLGAYAAGTSRNVLKTRNQQDNLKQVAKKCQTISHPNLVITKRRKSSGTASSCYFLRHL